MSAITVSNAYAVNFADVPDLPVSEFREFLIGAVKQGDRLSALFGMPSGNSVRLIAVLARDAAGTLSILSTEVFGSYASITPECMQAHWFEREIAELWGLIPQGHPWLKPIRFQRPMRPAPDPWRRDGNIIVGDANFFRIEGEEIHEVSVGPVHAGVIEPGHFRFQCQNQTPPINGFVC